MLFVFFSVTDLSGLNIQHAGKVWQMKKIYTETSQWKAILMNSLWLIGLVVVICLLSIYRANLSKSRHWYRECDLSLYKSVTIHDSSLVTFLLLDRVIWFWWKTENIFFIIFGYLVLLAMFSCGKMQFLEPFLKKKRNYL